MGSFYRLQIKCDKEQKEKLNDLLGFSNDNPELDWNLIIEEDSSKFNQALNFFVDLIEQNFNTLIKNGISMDMITFWYMYEYVGQCNMEFWPNITRKMGELGIVLCVSCWEK